MSDILLIHGPNLNLLGSREPDKYGNTSSKEIVEKLNELKIVNQIDYFQSNDESELIDCIQRSSLKYNGILINAGGFSHTSIAMADALRSISIPKISVHITNIFQRELYRHTDIIGEACDGTIMGLGIAGYELALGHIQDLIQASKTN